MLVPIASFGGAEKVAYAAARELKKDGFETHLFVLGSARMDVLDEFDAGFRLRPFLEIRRAGMGRDEPVPRPGLHHRGHELDWAGLKGPALRL